MEVPEVVRVTQAINTTTFEETPPKAEESPRTPRSETARESTRPPLNANSQGRSGDEGLVESMPAQAPVVARPQGSLPFSKTEDRQENLFTPPRHLYQDFEIVRSFVES